MEIHFSGENSLSRLARRRHGTCLVARQSMPSFGVGTMLGTTPAG